jgi:POT family proton-dependent oligopeptide transporter
MPWVAIAMCIVELAERASYHGTRKAFANFVRGGLPLGGNGLGAVAKGAAGANQTSGALGLGSVAASAIGSTFTFLSYVIPILGGILSDTRWGSKSVQND